MRPLDPEEYAVLCDMVEAVAVGYGDNYEDCQSDAEEGALERLEAVGLVITTWGPDGDERWTSTARSACAVRAHAAYLASIGGAP